MKMKDSSFAEVLHRAQHGDREAQDVILRLYIGLIDRNSLVDGVFDDDCRQYIMLRIVQQLPKFRGKKKN